MCCVFNFNGTLRRSLSFLRLVILLLQKKTMLVTLIFLLVASCQAVQYTIKVGGQFNVFSQPSINIQIGDTILWTFGARNHSVTQVSDGTTCSPMAGGFDSGLQIAPMALKWTASANGTYWYICKIPAHCASGMRGVVHVGLSENTTTASDAPSATQSLAASATPTQTVQVNCPAGYSFSNSSTAKSSNAQTAGGSSSSSSYGYGYKRQVSIPAGCVATSQQSAALSKSFISLVQTSVVCLFVSVVFS